MKLIIGGCRGTHPVCQPDFLKFGGETTAFLCEGEGGEHVLIDAGTGVRLLGDRLERADGIRSALLLMTHFHLDHVMGLPALSLIYNGKWSIEIASPVHQGQHIEEIMPRLLDRPFWPLQLDELASHVRFRTLPGEQSIAPLACGGLQIRWCPVHHPGGCTAYRIDEPATGTAVVIATDVEWGEASAETKELLRGLVHRPSPATLLLMDGQFTPDEYARHRGWGHSTWRECADLARETGAGHLLVTHHAPTRTDAQMEKLEVELRHCWPASALARERAEFDLSIVRQQRQQQQQ
jgi:ribonuclease BN (tRNA processing enzyme)